MFRQQKHTIRKHKQFNVLLPAMAIVVIAFITISASGYEESWSYNWDGIRKQIKDSIKVAESRGFISSGVKGVAGKKPKQFDRRFWIMKNATYSELLKLTDYPNGTIKAIAYDGLLRNKAYVEKFDLILKAFDENEHKVIFYAGCEGVPMYLREYLIEHSLYLYYEKSQIIKQRYNLSEQELNQILIKYHKLPRFLD